MTGRRVSQRWISPRKDRQNAIAMGERMADTWERQLGRRLTPAELRQVHATARQIATRWGSRIRKAHTS